MARDVFAELGIDVREAEGGDTKLSPEDAIKKVAEETGYSSDFLLGLAKLETRGGAATIKGDGVDTHNLFNIKDFSKDGTGIRATDKAEGSNHRYRQYTDYEESTRDLVRLLDRKYPDARVAETPQEFAQALKAGGYATDPAYVNKLTRVIGTAQGGSDLSGGASQQAPGTAGRDVFAQLGIDRNRPAGGRDVFQELGIDPKTLQGGRDVFAELGIDPKSPLSGTALQKAGDYAGAISSGLGTGVLGIQGGIGKFLQAPAANSLAAVAGGVALADRGVTWLANKLEGMDAKANPDIQQTAQMASQFAAEQRLENAKVGEDGGWANPMTIMARMGLGLQEDARSRTQAIMAADAATNPELLRQQQAMAQAEGFAGNLKAIADNPMAFTHTMARSVPDMLMGVGMARLAAGGKLAAATNVGDAAAAGVAKAGGTAAAQAEAAAAAMAPLQQQAVARASSAGLLSEAASSGMNASEGIYQQVMGMPLDKLAASSDRYKELMAEVKNPYKARERLANELADQAALPSAVVTGLGTGITNKIFGGDATAKTVAGVERLTGKELAKRAGQDTVEEVIQGVPEDTVQHGAVVQADPSAKLDVGGAIAQNAAAGLAMGGGMHGFAYGKQVLGDGRAPSSDARTSAPDATLAPDTAPATIAPKTLAQRIAEAENLVRGGKDGGGLLDTLRQVDGGPQAVQELITLLNTAKNPQQPPKVREQAMQAIEAQIAPAPEAVPETQAQDSGTLGPNSEPPAQNPEAQAQASAEAAEKALKQPVALTALDRAVELDAELMSVRERLQDETPENGYGPAFDQSRQELAAKAAMLEQERNQIAATWPQAAKGAPTSFSTESGVKLDGVYALMSADDLITSHIEGSWPNPLYPQELQPRDRSRRASELQVSGIVQKLDPARLGASADAATGAPIVGADGLVESGNARMIALKRVYHQANGQKAENYKAFLRDKAAQFGLDPATVDVTPKPVLVRVRSTPVNRAEFARQANASTVQRMSPSEQAKADAARLNSLEGLNPTEDGDFSNSRDFIRQFRSTLPITEQSEMMEADGRLSAAGYRRIQNAVLAKAYGDSPTLRRMTESMDNNLLNISKALLRVAPTIASARERMEAGALHQGDIAPDLVQAVEGLSALRDKGWTVAQELAQTDLTGQKYSPETAELMQFLADNTRSPRRIAEFFQRYYEALDQVGDPRQSSILGDAGPAPSRSDLLTQAREVAPNDNPNQDPQRRVDRESSFSDGQGGQQSTDTQGFDGSPEGDAATRPDATAGQPGAAEGQTTVDGNRESVEAPLGSDTRLAIGVAGSVDGVSGVPLQDLQALADRLKAKMPNMPKVNVLADPSSAPYSLMEYINRQDAWYDVQGAMHEGEFYLFGSGLQSLEQAEHVLAEHEAAHFGLRAVLGADGLKSAMQMVWVHNASVRKQASKLQERGRLSDAEATEEVIVDIPTKELAQLKGWRKVVLKVRDFLDRRGYEKLADRLTTWLNGSLDEQQQADWFVADLVRAARDYVAGQRDGRPSGYVGATRLSRLKESAASTSAPIALSRAHGGKAFNEGSATVIGTFKNDIPMKAHPDYKAAKGGDLMAAAALVQDLVKPEDLQSAHEKFGSDVVFVPVHAEEAAGRNQIPNALAMMYAANSGAEVDTSLAQANRAFHTGAGAMERLLARAEFSGYVEPGRRYVLVDDVTTMGSTLADLAAYIQSSGGDVAGSVVLVNAMRGGKIQADRKTVNQLEARHGEVIRELFGFGPQQLTAAEAQYLIGFRSADELRTRVVTAKQARVDRLASKNIPQRADSPSSDSRLSRAQQGGVAARVSEAINKRKTVVAGTTSRYTPAQMEAMKNVGFQVEQPSLKERAQALWQDAGKKLAQGIVDQFAPVKEISKDAYALLRLSKGASGAFETLLQGGKLKLSDGVYNFDEAQKGGVVDKLLTPLGGEHHDFFRWVAANRAERLMGESRENLFTPKDIAALKTLADGELPFDYTLQNGINKGRTTRKRAEAYRDSLITFNAFNKNVLDMAEQSGLIDAHSRALWEGEFYVPFYRVADEESGGVRGMNIKGSVVRQKAFEQLKGGKQKLNHDLLDNTLMNWAHLLDAAAKNRAAKATLEAAVNVGAAIEAPKHTLDEMASAMGKKDGAVWFMDGGKKRLFLVDDPYLMTAISSLEYAGLNSPIMNVMSAFKHALTIGVTASPFFKVRNLIRDSVQVIGLSGINTNPLKNVKDGWKLTDPKSDAYFRLLAGGGTIHFGTMMEGSEAKRVQALVESGVADSTILNNDHKVKQFYRKFIEPGITAYNELGNRGEAVNRAALYD